MYLYLLSIMVPLLPLSFPNYLLAESRVRLSVSTVYLVVVPVSRLRQFYSSVRMPFAAAAQ